MSDLQTNPSYTPHRKKTRRSGKGRLLFLLFLIAAASCAAYIYWEKNAPNKTHVQPDFGGVKKPLFHAGKQLELPAEGEKESLKLPFPIVKELLDPTIFYEEKTESVIITTTDKVVQFKTDQLTAMLNRKPFNLQFPIVKDGETVYIPIDPLKEYYGAEFRESAETGAVIMAKEGEAIQWAKAAADSKHPDKTAAMRQDASIKAPIYADVKGGDKVMIWSEKEGWYYVQLQNGYTGYMQKSDLVLDQVEIIPAKKKEKAYVPWKPTGGKINLTWEQVVNRNPDTAKIGDMPGLNVISPTWFQLNDGSGAIKNMADPTYVKWAHERGYQVWALFSNGFEPEPTTAALSTFEKRMKMAQQLISFAEMYDLQGINIDFENVKLSDKDMLTQFVRELTPLLHEQGLVVSMDVTVKSSSEMWSMFYDRPALAKVLDYMIVMTYDEHWASSPTSGSVASLQWVENGAKQLIEQEGVPASKLILGIPFYTRIWTETTANGKTSVKSKAVIMDAVNKIITEKKLKPEFREDTGQNYVEYNEEGELNRIWLEDGTSVKSRIELVKKYDLAGVASWRRGYETPNMWNIIQQTLDKRP